MALLGWLIILLVKMEVLPYAFVMICFANILSNAFVNLLFLLQPIYPVSPVAKLFSEITDEIKNGVDYIVKYRQDDKTIASPSSVIKWDNGNITVIRP